MGQLTGFIASVCVCVMHVRLLSVAAVCGWVCRGKDDAEAVSLYEKAARAGYPPALFALGSLHAAGKLGLKKDVHAAMDLYRTAVAKGRQRCSVFAAVCHTVLHSFTDATRFAHGV